MSEFRRKLMMAYAANLGRGDITYPGLIAAWSAKGKTNDDEDRAILKDLTGNGHDITLNGFAFSEMSGYGGYNYTYDNWTNTVNAEINGNVAIINRYPSTRSVLERKLGKSTPKTILRLKVSIEIKNNPNKLPIKMYFTGAADYPSKTITITESGIYELPQVTSNDCEGNGYYIGFQIYDKNLMEDDENYYCRIQLLPEYPDALVFDGVDDYGINKDMPILTDYTIIGKREYIGEYTTEKRTFVVKGISPNREFLMGLTSISSVDNFGARNKITIDYNNLITWQNKSSYNQQKITAGSEIGDDNIFYIGTLSGNSEWWFKGAFYSAYLFDRSLDEQEIKSFIRKYIDPEYLLPSEQIPTPDCYYDFSLGSNDDEEW